MIYIVLILSFILEGLFSNLIPYPSLLIPLFSIVSLVLLYPYYNEKKTNYLLTAIIMGIIYDIAYTNSPFVSTMSFAAVSVFVMFIYNYINYNLLNFLWINIASIAIFRIISYILYTLVSYNSFTGLLIIESIFNSLIINIIFGLLLYLLLDYLSIKFKIKRKD